MGLRFVGAAPDAEVEGEQKLPGRVNYFIGNTPSNWHRDIPTFGSVVYRDVYPGISMRFYGRAGRLEYDWSLRPGADPHRIRVAVTGSQPLALGLHGALLIRLGGAVVSQDRPTVYQWVAGIKRAVTGSYVVDRDGTFGVRVGPYDRNRPLTIDPVIRYATLLGDTTSAIGVAVDHTGNTYLTGDTYSPTFPGHGIAQPSLHAGGDTYIAKISPSGKALVYATYLGGTDVRRHLPNLPNDLINCQTSCFDNSKDDHAEGISIGSDNSVTVTGMTRSEDFPTANAAQSAFGGGFCSGGTTVTGDPTGHPVTRPLIDYCHDAYVSRLNSQGDGLVYSTYLGGNDEDVSYSAAVDGMGNAVVTGQTLSSTFPLRNALQTVRPGLACHGGAISENSSATSPDVPVPCPDAFVTKLAPTGSVIFSTFLGGADEDQGNAVTTGTDGSIYVAGITSSTDFPIRSGLTGVPGDPQGTGFVTKLSPDGQRLIYSTFFGGTSDNSAEPTETAGPSPTDTVGPTATDIPTSDFGTPVPPPTESPASVGGTEATGIAVDPSGAVFITGDTGSNSLPLKNAIQAPTEFGNSHAFVAKLNPTGNGLMFSTYLGGSGLDYGNGIAVDYAGEAFIVGTTDSVDFPTLHSLQPPPTPVADCGDVEVEASSGVCSDAFVVKLSPGGAPIVYSTFLGGDNVDQGNAIAVDDDGNAYIAGDTQSAQFANASYLPGQTPSESVSGFLVKIYDQPPPRPTPTATATRAPATPTSTTTKRKKLKKCPKGFKRVNGKCRKRG